MQKKEHILITGGAGFIGSHLAGYHLEKGDDVVAIDNLSSGLKSNLAKCLENPHFEFVKADVRTWDGLANALAKADRIYHLAAVVGQRLVLTHPIETLADNINSAERVLTLLSESPKKDTRILLTSTSEVYTHTQDDLYSDFKEDRCLSVASGRMLQETYPISKVVNELTGLAFAYQKSVHVVIARLFNTIGINQRSKYGMVVPTFVKQAVAGDPITVYGDGNQTRSFCNVLDIVTALDKLLSEKQALGEIVNVGNDEEISILELAKLVKELANSSSPITFTPFNEAYGIDFIDPQRRRPNLDKLKRLTGFTPRYTLKETLIQMITSTG